MNSSALLSKLPSIGKSTKKWPKRSLHLPCKQVKKALTAVGSAFLRSEKQAAEWLGISVYTLRRIRKRKEIGCYCIGGSYQYDIKHLENYIQSKELCPKIGSKSESIILSSIQTHQSSKLDGMTQKVDKHAAFLLAQKTFMKQKQH